MPLPRGLRLAIAALVALGSAAGHLHAQVAGAVSGAGPPTPASTPEITRGEVGAHIEYLASDELGGRRSGTPGAERAARYVMRAFVEYGLASPSKLPTYLQTFSYPVGVELGDQNRLVVMDGSRNVAVLQPGRDFLPLAGSLADRVVQPVTFVGYGISAPEIGYDDYAGIDVRGKVVLALRWSPEGEDPTGRFAPYLSERYKAATARAHGARAILFTSGPATDGIDRLIPFAVDERPERLGVVAISITQAAANRIASVAGVDLADLQLQIDESGEPRSRSLPSAAVNLRADVRPRTRTTHNVIGILPGRDPDRADEVVVVGGHYDGLGLGGLGSLEPVPGEIHNGADDNASGVAAVLELAQWFAYPTNRPGRTIAFVAFGAEEEGLLGSTAFVENPPFPLGNVVSMINLDMIGRLDEELIIYGVGTSPAWPAIIAEADEPDLGLTVRMVPEGYGPSDQAPFYLSGIPVLAFFTGVHGDYHRATDDVEWINLPGTWSVTRFVGEVIKTLANGPARPAFRPDFEGAHPARDEEEGESDGRPSVRARIGAVPRPTDAEGEVVIERIVPESPAAASGLEPGDRLVRLNGRPVETIYDYVRALATLEAGIPAGIVVRRAGRVVERLVLPVAAASPEDLSAIGP